MKGIKETEVSKESIALFADQLGVKLELTDTNSATNNTELEKNGAESIDAKNEIHFQNSDRKDLTNELILANKELAFQYKEKDKCDAELIIANSELDFQHEEKEKRESELEIANIELKFQNEEKEKRASELVIANNELLFQNLEKEKKAAELTIANSELKIAEEKLKQYIKGLKEMMFITSHKVRQPIANILGFSSMLHQSVNSPEDIENAVACIKKSAILLDTLTRELNSFICELGQTEDNNDQKC